MNSVSKNRFANSDRINSKATYPSPNSRVCTFPRVIRNESTQKIPQRNGNRKEIFGNSKTGIIIIDHAKKDLEKDPLKMGINLGRYAMLMSPFKCHLHPLMQPYLPIHHYAKNFYQKMFDHANGMHEYR
ncbi:hypothetical protein CEXT_207021 [Caerostris extrusa]|uniref:Uncharacterized protein n=1 Tax=Caerostris extrusa TaxID=172846 RepID=A0AAV4Q5S4_CAEEX|nr:hypothetical protein CEXT_207021 [Caerostris extrusa]